MPQNQVMISHAHADSDIAQALANLLSRCSLQQISCWYSSDPREGGVGVGQRWFERVREEMQTSRAMVVLLTPNSVQSSWVQFEAGFGAASAELEIIPLIVNLDGIVGVPDPITHWQIFDLKSRESAKTFVTKVLSSFSIHSDEDLTHLAIKEALNIIDKYQRYRAPSEPEEAESHDHVELTGYLDKKFFELHQAVTGQHANFISFDVRMQNELTAGMLTVSVALDTTMQDILNEVFWSMEAHVEPYTYMQTWLIVNDTRKRALVIREVAHQIPAYCLLNPQDTFRILKLSTPYHGNIYASHPDFETSFVA
ncbi:MAG: toll/interleukin-1 receptor domain-containing protein [Pseudomonadota bacterium]